MKLFISAISKLVIGLGAIATLLFAPAGTFAFPGAWRLLMLLFIPMIIMGVALLIWAPETLSRRLRSKEERVKQKRVVALSGILFVASFILAGLDFRFGWSEIPGWVTWTAGSIFLLSYGVYAEEGQKVVSTGLYGIVRHPMYTATIAMFLAMPLVMESWWAFLVMIPYVIAIVTRIKDEETLLTKELEGYQEYKAKVRWKLIPYIW